MKPRPPQPQALELDAEAGTAGPLWNAVKRQLHPSEAILVKRLVGQGLIEESRQLWGELESLQLMLSEFRKQNDGLLASELHTTQSGELRPEAASAGDTRSLHRQLLRQQAQVLLQDARSQAAVAGAALEELVPALGSKQLQHYVCSQGSYVGPPTPSTQPSSRPSSVSGASGCSGPELLTNVPVLPADRRLGADELGSVAAGVREALEEERSVLLAAIGEHMRLLEVEDSRRASLAGGHTAAGRRAEASEPSTEELQQLVHDLQEFTLVQGGAAKPPAKPRSSGAAQVRRLRALIEETRQLANAMAALPAALKGVPEVLGALGSPGAGKPFDPFFDDPFAA
eukprot:CAMPEP_0175366154 /NCGR_PEP_ID=MMETSP0095-20121207/18995_1 /TAXON_ID=311494 /ORGANISM="Alexandrium monilatum, Strain CCMP3105" /LENGTH=341 /DNA_ID=CAMNT_0016664161 /DNA_START=27 /DNA_END=1052 /DNA_ORIENTATION=-